MRIAATADLHFTPQSYDRIREPLSHVRDEADLLVIAGDLTNYGKPEEMHSLLNALVRLRIPIVAVLGNHDYERDGVGFAGAKGFPGGFGRGMLTAFGEKEIKAFVQAGLDETLKLERALTMLRTPKIVIVTHYAPICETVEGERLEIFPFLGSSRLSEVIDRHQAVVAFHGHAHHGKPDGKTIGGVPVHNVALSILMAQNPPCPYRVIEV